MVQPSCFLLPMRHVSNSATSENPAESVDADIYMVLTDVESVALDFGTDNQRLIRDITVT